MKQRMVIIASLGLCAYLVILAPVSARADEKKQTAVNKAPDEAPQPEQKKSQKHNDKDKWKKYILRKHENFLTWLNANYPAKYNELMKVLDTQPDKFASQIGGVIRTYDPIRFAQKNNPPLAKVLQEEIILKHRRDQLLHTIRNAEEKERQELVQQLKEVVATRFDNIIQKKGLQFKSLCERLERLKKDLEKRDAELETLKTEKDNNVDQRMKELLNDTGIDWK